MWTEKPLRRRTYLWQRPDWPRWRFDAMALAAPLAEVHRAQGHLAGRMADLGLAQRDQATLQTLTQEVVTTSAIEGEALDLHAVRSSIARRLGVDIGALAPADRHVDGVVDMVLDATQHYGEPLTAQRLFGWHAALFPTGYSGRTRIRVGRWRNDAAGPMQVVSGPVGREKVHYEAPPAAMLPAETAVFLQWFNATAAGDPLIHAGLAHLWLVTLHPFDDGNGRIHRFLIHHVLARAGFTPRGALFPVSAAIVRDMRSYDRVLEAFSGAIMPFIDWRADERGEVHVLNETAHLYRYFDATRHAEFLYDKVAETIRKDLREELDFVTVYDAAVRAVRERVDMPDRRVSLFVRFCLQNEGRLSKNKRKDFPELSDAELDELEALVAQARALRALPVDDADDTTRSPPR